MFQNRVLLHGYSNYKIGGPASYFYKTKTVEEIAAAVKTAQNQNLPIFILGGGTNLLINDEGFEGLVLKPEIDFLRESDGFVTVGAGLLMSELLDFCLNKALSGLEWAGGLPGTVGGAIRGNAGAFGGETKDVIKEVVSLDITPPIPKIIQRNNSECRFGYRDSIFKQNNGREIILETTLQLKKGDRKIIRQAVEEKIRYRQERHPLEYPNIGSIFKNVPVEKFRQSDLAKFKSVIKTDPFPVVPTACLIVDANLKGTKFGGAMISVKHPNFIVNVSEAKSSDVKTLINLVKLEVKKKFDVDLEEEIIYV